VSDASQTSGGGHVGDLQRLLDIEAIKQLKARYFALMDLKHWAEWRALFCDDARFAGTLQPPDASPDDFVDGVRVFLTGVLSVHQGHMPLIEHTGPDTARGLWAMYDWLEFPPEHPSHLGVPHRVGYGHYEERYRREPDGWRISYLCLTRLRVDRFDADSVKPPQQSSVPSSAIDWLTSRSGGRDV
jgi:hypothetical protein